MALSKPIREVKYVCNPQDIKIAATFPPGSSFLLVNLYVGKKLVLEGQYRATFPDKKEDFDVRVKVFCGGLSTFTEDEIAEYVTDDRYMGALYAFRTLKEVRNRTGGLIWLR